MGFAVTFSDGLIDIERRESSHPAATISGSTAAICQFLFEGVAIGRLEPDARITVFGDRQLFQELPAIFGSARTAALD